MSDLATLQRFTSQVRRDIVRMVHAVQSGHPGGSLGKKLYMRVSDIFLEANAPKVNLDDKIRTIILEMTSKRLGATAVITNDNRVAGIITDGDLR